MPTSPHPPTMGKYPPDLFYGHGLRVQWVGFTLRYCAVSSYHHHHHRPPVGASSEGVREVSMGLIVVLIHGHGREGGGMPKGWGAVRTILSKVGPI